MLRSFNILKSKKNLTKINYLSTELFQSLKNIQIVKDKSINNVDVPKYFFSSDKNDIKETSLQINLQNSLIKEAVEVQITKKKSKLKSSKKSIEILVEEDEKQVQSKETNDTINLTQNQQASQKQIKKKPRKRNKKNKKLNQKEQSQQVQAKVSQQDSRTERKTRSFYKILFPQIEYQKQEEKLLNFLQKSHQKSMNQQNQDVVPKVQKQKNKKKKKIQQPVQKNVNRRLFEQKSIIQVMGLDDLLVQVNKDIQFPKIQEFEQNLFNVLGQKRNAKILLPFGFRYYLFRYCKYQIYFRQLYNQEEIIKYQMKFLDAIRFYCLGKKDTLENKIQSKANQNNELNNLQVGTQLTSNGKQQLQSKFERLPYMQHFMTNLIPLENTQAYTDIYLQVGIQYLKLLKQKLSQPNSVPQQVFPSVNTLRMILTNLKRLLFNNCEDFQIDDAKEQDYLLYRTFFNQFLDFYCFRKYKFQTADKVECVQIAKFLKIPHAELMQFTKQFVQDNLQNFSMVQFLLMLGYLVQNKNTPYEYFYKQKGNWMKIIESSHDFSSKKTRCCIKLLQVLSRQRFMNCEKIYSKLLQIITNNLEAMEGKQLVRILYYYSKTRYGTNPIFISNLVDKISRWLPYLEERHFSLLVRSIGNLNYQSAQLVQKLKNINYERFLSELKYGCQNLGSYYQQILKQVEKQSRRKQYFDGEEVFYPSTKTENRNQQNSFVAAEKIF